MENNSLNNEKCVILEGITSISACIRSAEEGHPSRKIYEVLIDLGRISDAGDRLRRRLSYLRAKSEKHGFPLRLCDSAEIASLATGTTHGGIIARTEPRVIPTLEMPVIEGGGFYMLFDGIEDPYSFGYSLRSLYAAGADGVSLPGGHLINSDGIISRASAGTYELLPIYSIPDGSAKAVKMFRSAGYRVLCSEIRDSVPYLKAGLKRPLLIVMGGEKRGISSALTAACDGNISISYGRPFMGSLSTASAVAVLAFEVLRNSEAAEN